jgi:mitochondrial fission protein ELM1
MRVMATASRRTPAFVIEAVTPQIEASGGWLWDGAGDNPYFSMLAKAETILVTADSVSMIGEAVATGAPVYVFAVAGGSRKIADYLAKLENLGAVRPWMGEVESWTYEPVQSTPHVAQAAWRAYKIYRGIPY